MKKIQEVKTNQVKVRRLKVEDDFDWEAYDSDGNTGRGETRQDALTAYFNFLNY